MKPSGCNHRFFAIVLSASLLAAACSGADVGRIHESETLAASGSGEPNLATGADGGLYLSWIEPDGEGHALRFATWQGDGWSAPATVARGEEWFVNWADFPSLAAAADGTLAAHWLVRDAEEKYAYGVRLSVSSDGGRNWSEPVIAHRDATPTEHGFASIVPRREGGFHVVWLDGRNTAAMSLRHAVLSSDGTVGPDSVIDDRVCECCSTDAVLAPDGSLVVVYRGRSADEIRDIRLSRLDEGGWSPPLRVHADNWRIAACPVNGPALAADDQKIAIAWFTVAGGEPRVLAAFSDDSGRGFGVPLRLDGGDPLGRVDVVLDDDGSAIVSWLEKAGGRARIRLRRVRSDGSVDAAFDAVTTGAARSSGFPRIARHEGRLFLAWTEPGDPAQVRAGWLR